MGQPISRRTGAKKEIEYRWGVGSGGAWDGKKKEEREVIREAGIQGGTEEWRNATEEIKLDKIDVGRNAHTNLSSQAQTEVIVAGQTACEHREGEQLKNIVAGKIREEKSK